MSIGFDRLPDAVAAADVIVVGTGADEAVLTTAMVADARAASTPPRLLHVVDIGVPRNVDPAVGELPGVRLADLDDLRDWADRGLSHRAAEAERVRVIVAEEAERFLVESTARQAAPLVALMRGAADRVRLDQHLEGVRELEQRLAILEENPPNLGACERVAELKAAWATAAGPRNLAASLWVDL